MNRARILAGAAVLAAACALPSAAQAQIGPCPTLQPPPCIVIDPSKIAQSTAEIANKTKQITELANKAKEMASIQGLLGKLKAPGMGGYGGLAPIAPTNPTTISAAAADISKNMPVMSGSPDQQRAISAKNRILVRSAAGDGYALSQAMKQRLLQFQTDAVQLQGEAVGGADVRYDWQINNRARNLMMRALVSLREVQSARINLEAVQQLGKMEGTNALPSFQHAEAAAIAPQAVPTWGKTLGDISSMTNKLQALQTARQLSISHKDSLDGFAATQAEYQQMLGAAQSSQRDVQNIANRDAQRNVPASKLIQRADQIMAQRDQTTWDNPDKAKIAKNAADYAEDQLDKLVSGDVSNSWSDYLRNRAEAYKQEAFFRPINADAIAARDSSIAYMKEFEDSVGFPVADIGALDRQIAETTAQLKALGGSLDTAPDPVKAQREAIFASTMAGAEYTGGTPNMTIVDHGDQDIDPTKYGYDKL